MEDKDQLKVELYVADSLINKPTKIQIVKDAIISLLMWKSSVICPAIEYALYIRTDIYICANYFVR